MNKTIDSTVRRSIGSDSWWKSAAVLGVLAYVFYLYAYDPTAPGVGWTCPIQSATGLECAGCGGQRAIHALLHGRIREAFLFNPYLCGVAFPFAPVLLLRRAYGQYRGQTPWNPSRYVWIGVAGAGTVFTLVRNLW